MDAWSLTVFGYIRNESKTYSIFIPDELIKVIVLFYKFKIKIKKICTPRPGGYSDDDIAYESPQQPAWYRHSEKDELLSLYEPIRELGT